MLSWFAILNKTVLAKYSCLLCTGKQILAFIREEQDATTCLQTLEKVMLQLRQLDSMGVHKGELVKPDRHILVRCGGDPVLIDFERCRESSSPQNLTQFCQFLVGKPLAAALAERSVKMELDVEVMRELCKSYKANHFQQQDFVSLLDFLRKSIKII